MKIAKYFLLLAPFFQSALPAAEQARVQGDIVVYGGTSAGVVAAIRAAQSGKKVYLVSPDVCLGAMTSSGLGMTDSGRTQAIGGLAREFYKRVYAEYQKPENWFAEKPVLRKMYCVDNLVARENES